MPQKIDTSKIDDMKVKYLGVSRPNDWRNVFSSIFAVYITYHLIFIKQHSKQTPTLHTVVRDVCKQLLIGSCWAKYIINSENDDNEVENLAMMRNWLQFSTLK